MGYRKFLPGIGSIWGYKNYLPQLKITGEYMTLAFKNWSQQELLENILSSKLAISLIYLNVMIDGFT